MKRAILVGMVGLCLLGWCVTAKALVEKPALYRQLLREAEQYESEKIYVRAIETYKEALEYRPDSVELQKKIAVNYLALGDESSFMNRCNSINETYHYPLSVATVLADYYIDSRRNEKAILVLQNAMKYHKDDEELLQRFEQVRYTYKDLYMMYEKIEPFRNDSAVAVQEGNYGLVNTKGKAFIKCQNDGIGPLSSERDAIPVCRDGEFYYANSSGYRIEIPKEGQAVEQIGVLCNGAAPAKINGKYGYINVKFEEQSPFIWDDATVIQNGFGAVKQNEKWALINSSYELITDYLYDDVRTDEYGYCSISGRAFVKKDGIYQMIDKNGERIGGEEFQDAVVFSTEEPTAVKIGEQWGFADLSGMIVIEPQYENAGSFSNGLAPVQTLSGWGYINRENQLVIEAEFTEACSFYKGVAPVKKGNTWTVIELNVK